MRYSVSASITPYAAAKLFLSGDLDPACIFSEDEAEQVFTALIGLSVDECLSVADSNRHGAVADSKNIPQFGKIETVARVPNYFFEKGVLSSNDAQLGLFLKNDSSASLGANKKFGENHGKAAAILGLIRRDECHFSPTAFSKVFYRYGGKEKMEILTKLFFRIPIIQIILKEAKQSQVNGYKPMSQLGESTKLRRGINIKAILEELRNLNHPELTHRIQNVVWTDCKEEDQP